MRTLSPGFSCQKSAPSARVRVLGAARQQVPLPGFFSLGHWFYFDLSARGLRGHPGDPHLSPGGPEGPRAPQRAAPAPSAREDLASRKGRRSRDVCSDLLKNPAVALRTRAPEGTSEAPLVEGHFLLPVSLAVAEVTVVAVEGRQFEGLA